MAGRGSAVSAAPLEEPTKIDLFEAGAGGYVTCRIPGIVVTPKGTVLVYCEARKGSASDWAEIDIISRRSSNGGATWEAPRKLVEALKGSAPNTAQPAQKVKVGGPTLNNPVAIVDPMSGVIHFLYCVNYERCFYTHSDDDGKTFAEPREITSTFEKFRPEYDWKVIATGPGHGIKLTKTGRLVVPVWMSLGTGRNGHHPSCVATIISDDAGKSWQAGEIAAHSSSSVPDPNETTAVELSDGRVMLNTRCESPKHRRVIESSNDGSTGWSKPVFDDALPDPICFASLVRVPHPDPAHEVCLAFSNPSSDSAGKGLSKLRINLTVRLSFDDGKTWPASRLLDAGAAGYSDLAAGVDGTLYCFYERGNVGASQFSTKSLCLARFRPEWVMAASLNAAQP